MCFIHKSYGVKDKSKVNLNPDELDYGLSLDFSQCKMNEVNSITESFVINTNLYNVNSI